MFHYYSIFFVLHFPKNDEAINQNLNLIRGLTVSCDEALAGSKPFIFLIFLFYKASHCLKFNSISIAKQNKGRISFSSVLY